MTKSEMIAKMAPLVRRVLYVDDPEAESKLQRLEAQARQLWPREYKQIEAAATNFAQGHRAQ